MSAAFGDVTRPRRVSVFSGPTRRKQRDHGAVVRLELDGGREAAVISEEQSRQGRSLLTGDREDGRTLV